LAEGKLDLNSLIASISVAKTQAATNAGQARSSAMENYKAGEDASVREYFTRFEWALQFSKIPTAGYQTTYEFTWV